MYSEEYLKSIENTILNMDCNDFLKECPDKWFDLVLTDAPYGGGGKEDAFSNGGNRFGGRFEKYDQMVAEDIKCTRTGGQAWNHKYDDIQKITDWDYAPPQETFNEMFRVSKNQIFWGGNYFDLPPTRCFNIWKKLTISEKFSMAMCEYAWTSFNQNAKLWEFAPQDLERFHKTQKPVELIAKQIELYSKPGDLILDCFSGSGTTAIAAHRLGRRFICVELNPYYWRKSVERLEKEKQQPSLFGTELNPEQQNLF